MLHWHRRDPPEGAGWRSFLKTRSNGHWLKARLASEIVSPRAERQSMRRVQFDDASAPSLRQITLRSEVAQDICVSHGTDGVSQQWHAEHRLQDKQSVHHRRSSVVTINIQRFVLKNRVKEQLQIGCI